MRKRILDAALTTFSVHGFNGSSIANIARQHGVSPTLIHYYFDSKEELWRAALERGIGDVLHNLEDTMRDLSEVDCIGRLKFFIRRYIAIMADRTEVFRVIIRESEEPGPRLTYLSKRYLTPLYAMFVGVLESAQTGGRLKNDVPSYHLAQIIAGACYQFIGGRNRILETYGVDTTSLEAREAHANAVIDVLFNGMLRSSANAVDTSRVQPHAKAEKM